MSGVIGIPADKDDIIWMLDMGDATDQPKLVASTEAGDAIAQATAAALRL